MNHDLLQRLAEVDDPVVVPELAVLERRAKRIRRDRYGRRAISAAGLAALMTLALVALPATQANHGGRPAVFVGISAASANDGARDCRVFVDSSWLPDEKWSERPEAAPAVSYLGGMTSGLESAGLHEDVGSCPTALPAGVLLGTSPIRAVTVWSDVRNPYVGTQGLTSVKLRGTEGKLLVQDNGSRVIAWTEAGRQWVAEASGIEGQELTSTLDALKFDDRRLITGSVPPGLRSIAVAVPSQSSVTTSWETTYDDKGMRYGLSATADPEPPPAVYVSREAAATEIRALGDDVGVYTFFGPSDDPVSGTVTWVEDGVTYTLNGPADPDRLFALAETVATTTAADPLWAEIPNPADRAG